MHKDPLSIVNAFLDLTNNKRDIAGALALMAGDVHFVGPAMETRGTAAYGQVLEKFLPVHTGWKKLAEFENGSEVCVIDEIYLAAPAGGTVTLKIAEWFTVRDARITRQVIYYDPREFLQAFGM